MTFRGQNQLDQSSGIGWIGRAKTAAYTSPSGKRLPFIYDSIGREIELRTTSFQFNGINGVYVQQNGNSGGTYPMDCVFSGPDHDMEATRFEAALLEDGVGILEHPLGTFDVVPVGAISRSTNYVNDANASSVSVTFSSTLATAYPNVTTKDKNSIDFVLNSWSPVAAANFATSANISTSVQKANLASFSRSTLKDISKTFGKISQSTSEASASYATLQREVNTSIDILVGNPIALASQISKLILTPATFTLSLETKMAAYGDFLQRIFTNIKNRYSTNSVALVALSTNAALVGSAIASNGEAYKNRNSALGSAARLSELSSSANEALGTAIFESGFVDTGESYQVAQEAIALTIGRLISSSSSLSAEKSFILQQPRNPVELCAELYGSVSDPVLQKFMDDNNVNGSEFYIMNEGRKIVYYG